MLQLLINGAIIGVIVAAPIGPVNLICIQRAVERGWFAGFLAGLGAVAGDALYAIAAAFGLLAVSDLTSDPGISVRIAGGLFLLGLGLRIFLQPAPNMQTSKLENAARADLQRTIVITFTATILNPATLLGFIAIFAGAGDLVTPNPSTGDAWTLVLGVALGSALWWLALTQFVGAFRQRITPEWVRRLNQVSGLMIAMFGVWLLTRLYLTGGQIGL